MTVAKETRQCAANRERRKATRTALPRMEMNRPEILAGWDKGHFRVALSDK